MGFGFLWRKTFTICINIKQKDDVDRCLVMALQLNNYITVNLISLCFPCFVSDVNYSVELGYCTRFIEEVLCDGNDVIIFSDLNFECSIHDSGFIPMFLTCR